MMDSLRVLMLLVLVHLLYDFHWQGQFVAEWKAKSEFIMAVHVLTWALLVLAVLYWLTGPVAAWKLAMLPITHYLTDTWKYRQKRLAPLGAALYIDQGIHIVTLVMAVML